MDVLPCANGRIPYKKDPNKVPPNSVNHQNLPVGLQALHRLNRAYRWLVGDEGMRALHITFMGLYWELGA